MTVYFGRAETKLHLFVSRHPFISAQVDAASRLAHKALGERWIPNLRREMAIASHRLNAGDEFVIHPNEFNYNLRKICSNPIGEYFPESAVVSLDSYRPENLIEMAKALHLIGRTLESFLPKDEVLRKSRSIGNPYRPIIDILYAVRTSAELRKAADSISYYGQNYGDPFTYIHDIVVPLLRNRSNRGDFIDQLKIYDDMIHLYGLIFGDPKDFVQTGLSRLVREVDTTEELTTIATIICQHSYRFGNPTNLTWQILPVLLEKAYSRKALYACYKETADMLDDYLKKFGSHDYAAVHFWACLPTFLRTIHSFAELQHARLILSEKLRSISDPLEYISIVQNDLPDYFKEGYDVR